VRGPRPTLNHQRCVCEKRKNGGKEQGGRSGKGETRYNLRVNKPQWCKVLGNWNGERPLFGDDPPGGGNSIMEPLENFFGARLKGGESEE